MGAKKLKVYNPNNYTKKHCGRKCCVTGYNCTRLPFNPTKERPTDNHCWQTSYRWHLEYPDKWGDAGKAVVMMRLVEDGALGEGQKTEKEMADNMKILQVDVPVQRLNAGERGGAKLDDCLDKVDELLKLHGIADVASTGVPAPVMGVPWVGSMSMGMPATTVTPTAARIL